MSTLSAREPGPKFWPLISPQGDGNVIEAAVASIDSHVLALNFPARGRKLENALWSQRFDRWFWPLISPQGDGNNTGKSAWLWRGLRSFGP